MTKQITAITQEQIEELDADISERVDEYYDQITEEILRVCESLADKHDFNTLDVAEIVSVDNYSIDGDERNINIYAYRIRGWKPEHREKLLSMLSN